MNSDSVNIVMTYPVHWTKYQVLRVFVQNFYVAVGYNDFVIGYESGMTMVEIAKRNNVSERTIYRYKAYYDKMKKKEE